MNLPKTAVRFRTRWLPYLPLLAGIMVLLGAGVYMKLHQRPKPQPGYISLFAGSGHRRFRRSGARHRDGPAVEVKLQQPLDVTMDRESNLYIADANRVEKVTPKGWLSGIAGTSDPGFSGEGKASTQAELDGPRSLAMDTSGYLYIADSRNFRVRRIDRAGRIQTVAGNGKRPSSLNRRLLNDEGKLAIQTAIGPSALACDAKGNLYLAEPEANRVRKVDPNGIITTFAGTGAAGFTGDGGLATRARLNGPSDVAVDAWGNLYIADKLNKRIRRVDPRGIITTFAGTVSRESSDMEEERVAGYIGENGPALRAQFIGPSALTVDAEGNLFMVDGYWIRKVAPNGTVSTVAGMKSATRIPTGSSDGTFMNGMPATEVWLIEPTAVTVDVEGNLLIAEKGTHRIRKVEAVAGPGLVAGQPMTASSTR